MKLNLTPEEIYNLAVEHHNSGSYSKAVELYEKYYKMNPGYELRMIILLVKLKCANYLSVINEFLSLNLNGKEFSEGLNAINVEYYWQIKFTNQVAYESIFDNSSHLEDLLGELEKQAFESENDFNESALILKKVLLLSYHIILNETKTEYGPVWSSGYNASISFMGETKIRENLEGGRSWETSRLEGLVGSARKEYELHFSKAYNKLSQEIRTIDAKFVVTAETDCARIDHYLKRFGITHTDSTEKDKQDSRFAFGMLGFIAMIIFCIWLGLNHGWLESGAGILIVMDIACIVGLWIFRLSKSSKKNKPHANP